MELRLTNGTLKLVQGDIIEQEVDAIVNAANSRLAGGGGVDGAIHRAAGPELHRECTKIIRKIGRLDPGNAVHTGSGKLREKGIKWVIHTVGPIWRGGKEGEAEILERCYRNSMKLARKIEAKSIAFPSISTGAYGYPVEKAAKIALSTIIDELETHEGIEEVRMVLYLREDFITYSEILRNM
jgi:O-acetyl-ADP-ribose deacetylase (regulator of RNase III)